MHRAVDELAHAATFRGYGPEEGYPFLIDAIIKHDYAPRGVHLERSEIFVSDGSKSDTGHIGDILRHDNSIGVTDPIYPAYIDSNVSCGRAGELLAGGKWSNVIYMPCLPENNFIPPIPDHRVDIIYLCYPNNPTGTVLDKSELKKWVTTPSKTIPSSSSTVPTKPISNTPAIPHSIYEIKGARKVRSCRRWFSPLP